MNLSSSSLSFFYSIMKKWKEIKVPIQHEKKIHQHIKSPLWTSIPEPLKSKIDSLSNGTLFSLILHNRTIQVYLWSNLREEKQSAISLIYKWFYFILPYCPASCSQHIDVHVYFLSHIKILPKKGEKIDTIHVNSAFTTSCLPNDVKSEIVIFRKEEWFKVLIHESFHVLGLDFSSESCEEVNSYIKREIFKGGVHVNDFRLYESYSEICAELLNVLFSSTRENLLEHLKLERNFSLFQWAKILYFYGLNMNDLLFDKDNIEKYTENTKVLSYYAFKSVDFYYLDDFVSFFLSKNNPFYFIKTRENIIKYAHFLRERIYTKDYLDTVDYYIGIQKYARGTLKNTLRMSLISGS